VVVLQVGQVVGEVGEVVADASLQVLADVMIDCGQRATAPLTDIREVKRSNLGQAVPLTDASFRFRNKHLYCVQQCISCATICATFAGLRGPGGALNLGRTEESRLRFGADTFVRGVKHFRNTVTSR
jgi:hypothetical protein